MKHLLVRTSVTLITIHDSSGSVMCCVKTQKASVTHVNNGYKSIFIYLFVCGSIGSSDREILATVSTAKLHDYKVSALCYVVSSISYAD